MSGLAALLAGHTAPGVYGWHSAASVADVEHAVEHVGWSFCHLDGWAVEDRESFLKATAASLQVAGSFTGDLESLATCLDGLDAGERGTVLLWDGWSPLARHDAETFDEVLEVLRRRASSDGPRFAALLRGEGPDVDLEELPIKH
jgi:hypothetical protein